MNSFVEMFVLTTVATWFLQWKNFWSYGQKQIIDIPKNNIAI